MLILCYQWYAIDTYSLHYENNSNLLNKSDDAQLLGIKTILINSSRLYKSEDPSQVDTLRNTENSKSRWWNNLASKNRTQFQAKFIVSFFQIVF